LSVPTGGIGIDTVKLETVVAGAVVTLASANFNNVYRTNYRFRLIAFATGRTLGYVLADDGITVLVSLDASSSAVATGGALERQGGSPGPPDGRDCREQVLHGVLREHTTD
jgi:hypothetical protein